MGISGGGLLVSVLGEGRQTGCREKFNCNIISVKAPFNHIEISESCGVKSTKLSYRCEDQLLDAANAGKGLQPKQ